MKTQEKKYLLGIDFGGGSAKATLLSFGGQIIAEAGSEYPTYYPQKGFCEQRPDDWKKALREVSQSLLRKSGINAAEIAAVALDSATHTAVLCDEKYEPLGNAVHWTDSRASAEAEELRRGYGERIFALTCHRPDTIWTMPQLLWMKKNRPEIFAGIRHIFFEKDYLRYLLTGVWCTDAIEAGGSMLYDLTAADWSEELCSLIGLGREVLPPLCAPSDIIGRITADAAVLTGLAEGTAVVAGTTDTATEMLAAGAVKKGDTTVKLATAGRICVISDRACPDRDLVNYPHVVKGLWYPGSATKAAASSLRWYRDTFGGDYRTMDEEAASVPVGCEGLFYHPYINGELTPYADPLLCGSFVGIRSTHNKAHFNRAVLEGVAFSLLHSKKKLGMLGLSCAEEATLIGGGSKSRLWGQILADCLGIGLRITESSDSSLGSAMLAGVAVGVFGSFEKAVEKCVHVKDHIVPRKENTEKYEALFTTYEKIHDALAPVYHGEER